ncbi:MAG: hypothetical protein BRC26_00785 [Nanohaloarchaea archaeon QH_8_44_6]|nr:MAG: hypothetical protein BRC26_00785 [Nanohaloarchaea archaeon QH_8_44_6]
MVGSNSSSSHSESLTGSSCIISTSSSPAVLTSHPMNKTFDLRFTNQRFQNGIRKTPIVHALIPMRTWVLPFTDLIFFVQLRDMELFLCRHGKTEHNENGIVQGQMDSRINEEGREQARRLRDRLAEEGISKVYSSSMTRAVETAEIVAEPHDLEVEKSEELKEVSRAEFEGERFEDLIEEIFDSETEDYLWKPEGGESLEEVKERGLNFLNSIKEKNEGEKVVVVSHGGTISSTLLGILEHSAKNCYRINQENCNVNKLNWTAEREWSIDSVNEKSHLY